MAVEFAFVFPILFLLMYGVIAFSYAFVIKESITHAAQEAAEAAVAVDPACEDCDYDGLVTARAREMVRSQLSWLPPSQLARVVSGEGDGKVEVSFCTEGAFTGVLPRGFTCPPTGSAVVVRLVFDLAVSGSTALFPVVNMPMVGPVPPLPAQLTAVAVARI